MRFQFQVGDSAEESKSELRYHNGNKSQVVDDLLTSYLMNGAHIPYLLKLCISKPSCS